MSDFTTSDGVRIHYQTAGKGDPVLLIHGLGSSGLDWENQIQHFSNRHFVIAADNRGHGQSDIPRHGYSIARFAQDQIELLDSLGLDQAHVIGLSMGGGIAFQIAVDAPTRVRSMAIINSAPSAKTRDPRFLFFLLLRRLLARIVKPAQTAPKLAQKLFPDPDMQAQRNTFIERVSKMDPLSYRLSLEALLRLDLLDRMGSLEMPILMLCSEYDYVPPESKKTLVTQMKNARLEIVPGAHHALPLEYPELCNASLDKFLIGIPAAV